jgi:hypothetical protein
MDKRIWMAVLGALLALGLGAGGYLWWRQQSAPPAPVAVATPIAAEPVAAAASAPPAIRHPIETLPALPDPNATLPPLNASDGSVRAALADLLGEATLGKFFQTDGFIARMAATVENLGLDHAPSRLWPVNPTAGRFIVAHTDSGDVIGADNAQRYAPFVRMVEAIDTPRAVALYVRLYPLFQQAYSELGYPRSYFNDKLVAAIDHLLEAPVPHGPIAVQLTEVKGPIAPTQPWTRYEFADPGLQALSAGQKIMVRMGNDNELRLKAKLSELRRGIASGATTR